MESLWRSGLPSGRTVWIKLDYVIDTGAWSNAYATGEQDGNACTILVLVILEQQIAFPKRSEDT